MTGYGRGVAEEDGFTTQVELRSVNHRFLETRVRGLGNLPQLARRCEQLLRGRFARGALELTVRWEKDGEARPKRLNFAAARRYSEGLKALAAVIETEEQPRIDHLIRLGVFEEEEPELESLWSPLADALEQASRELDESRAAEGKRLGEALQRELHAMGPLLERAAQLAAEERQGLEEQLRERLQRMDVEMDPGRSETELALWAERGDVQEEMDRLRSHVDRLREVMEGEGSVGRELEFLAQEVAREAGTVGAKARGQGLSRVALDLRVVAERIREQARNVQ
ncbi:MAG: DUF1732 domain-containing protein [Candidatus Bipolaricaulota bacterium]